MHVVRVVALCSIKGGVGKTTAAVNFAALSAAEGRRTLLWDLDPQGAAAFLLGAKGKVKGGSLELLAGSHALSSAVRETPVPGLSLLPADLSNRAADLVLDDAKKPTRQVARLLRGVQNDYDVVLLDCPPGLTLLSENVYRAAELLVTPLVPTPLTVRTYEHLLVFLDGLDDACTRVHPFFSMVDRRKTLHTELRRELLQRSTRPLTAWVPSASVVERMAVTHKPVVRSHPRSPVAQAYRDLWTEVRGLLAEPTTAGAWAKARQVRRTPPQ